MRGPVQRIVLIPRFTAFYGPLIFKTVPLNVREFANVMLTVWRSTDFGAAGVGISVQPQQSADVENWHDVGSPLTPSAGGESVAFLDLDLEWMRLAVNVSGGDLGLTAWSVGDFVPRDSEAG